MGNGWLKTATVQLENECMSFIHLSVTSISSHSFKARELKFGMHNSHLNGSKSTKRKFDAEKIKFKVE